MRTSAAILSSVALGAMLVLGTATASMARGGGGHGGHGDHAGMSASAASAGSRASVSDRSSSSFSGNEHADRGQNDGMRDGSDKGDDPWQTSPYYHGAHGSLLDGLFRR